MELTTAAAKKIAEKATEQALKYTIEKVKDATRPKTDNPVVPICERLSSEIKAGLLSDAALEARMEGAAHSECKFFELPESELVKRDSITDCMKRCDLLMADDKTLFSLDQFKDMNSLSFEDMSKVWSHECGHRVLQVYEMSPRVQELGADFFMGVRSEMLGLPNGNLEKALGESKGGNSHSPGHLRLQAIQYGRETVQDFKKAGVPITMQNLREAFRMSRFAKIGEHEVADTKVAALANDKAWHYKEVAKAQDNANYYSHEAKKAADKGDFMRAKDLQSKVDFYENKTNEEKRIADAFSIPVEKTDYEMAEKSQPQLAEFSENIKGNPYGNLYKDITVESYKQGEEALKMLSEEDPQLYAHVREMMNEGEPFSNQDYFLNYFECAKGENGELLFFNSAPEAVNSAILVKENTIKAISGCPVLKEGCGAPNFLIDRALPNKHYIVDNMEFQTDKLGRTTYAKRTYAPGGNVEIKSDLDESRRDFVTKNKDGRGSGKDDAGHILQRNMGGINEGINLVPMDNKFQRSGGDWRALEAKEEKLIASAKSEGETAISERKLIYQDDCKRPSKIEMIVTINGEMAMNEIIDCP